MQGIGSLLPLFKISEAIRFTVHCAVNDLETAKVKLLPIVTNVVAVGIGGVGDVKGAAVESRCADKRTSSVRSAIHGENVPGHTAGNIELKKIRGAVRDQALICADGTGSLDPDVVGGPSCVVTVVSEEAYRKGIWNRARKLESEESGFSAGPRTECNAAGVEGCATNSDIVVIGPTTGCSGSTSRHGRDVGRAVVDDAFVPCQTPFV